ncbi:MAG: LPS export ABC transporter periplasmic protein LptC [Bacteroidia bacterium]|nr:LPS export ABC transporter periplasmic protein LptC [Bacteroidia bacterium]
MSLQVCLFISCGAREIDKIKVASNAKPLPVERGTNISIHYSDSGYLKARLFAPLLERYSNEQQMETEMKQGITAYFYSSNGRINSYLKSKYAMRDERLRTITARNDVQVINIKGDTLKTEELIWDEKTDKIYSNKFVKINSPDRIIFGTGLEANTDFTRFKVLNITGIISLKQ